MNGRTTVVLVSLAVTACGASGIVSQPSPLPPSPATPAATTPAVSSVSPATATAGSEDITITITGSGFQAASSFAVWSAPGEETELLTHYVSETRLTAIVRAELLKHAGAGHVSVVNGDPMAWSDGFRRYPVSNALSFDVVGSQPAVLSIRSISTATPSLRTAGALTTHTYASSGI